jgi:tetratricopeptide (TPR) repeat protein
VGIVVALTVLAALLAAPRATRPDVLPLPIPDRAVLRRVYARTSELAQNAQTTGLSFDVRAVGEAIRNCGAETVEGKGVSEAVLGQVRMAVRRAREQKNEPGLLGLLALQTRLFIDATHAFEKTGNPSTDLRELGGDFVWVAKQNGWLDGRKLVLDDDERAAIFRMRWTELTALRSEAAFSPTLDEYRAYYALYLRRAGISSREGGERAFSVVRALEKRDPSYPAAFARGVLFYRAGSFDEAADAFRMHLALHPDGPWTLRAKNHVLEALAQASRED